MNNLSKENITLKNLSDLLTIKSYALVGAYPNPFNPSTKIVVEVPEKSILKLEIYDILGRKVKTLMNREVTMGRMEIIWNGSNDFGSKVASGNYIVMMKANDFMKAIKVNLIK